MDFLIFSLSLFFFITYKLLFADYSSLYFNLKYDFIFRSLVLPILLFSGSRICTRFFKTKWSFTTHSQKVICVAISFIWLLHIISSMGVRFWNFNYHVAFGLYQPWIFILLGIMSKI